MAKLTVEKFIKKNVHLKKQKQDKIPLECRECCLLSDFTNEITTYFYCGKFNNQLNV